jgi:hypothetical protein
MAAALVGGIPKARRPMKHFELFDAVAIARLNEGLMAATPYYTQTARSEIRVG